jgi:hypothetical protein
MSEFMKKIQLLMIIILRREDFGGKKAKQKKQKTLNTDQYVQSVT